jgi:acyl-CoA thioester hydrolase|tara:strand:+ start:59 stop:502 length:444 start_codon:yes stop_codon:yes gene_type:complete
MARPSPPSRSAYPVFSRLATRWDDNDIYGHLNNTVHYKLFDTAVNGWLLDAGLLDPLAGDTIFLVVETGCSYFSELTYPQAVDVGMRVARLGITSVQYDIGLFAADTQTVAVAQGRFVHVNVDRVTRMPAPLSDTARVTFETLIQDT